MIELNELQSEFLRECFEEVFDQDTRYFDLVDIDEIYGVLIGENIHDIFDRVEQTATVDDRNFSFVIFLGEWMRMIEKVTVGLEFFELAANAVEFKKEITKITTAI
jgi:hypothetical protein